MDTVPLLQDLDRIHREKEGEEEEENVPTLDIKAPWTQIKGIANLHFSPDGKLIAVRTKEGQVHVYDTARLRQGKQERWTWDPRSATKPRRIKKFQWKPESKESNTGKYRFLALEEHGQLYLGQVGDHDFQKVAPQEKRICTAFSWSPCGKYICAGNNETIGVISMEDITKALVRWEVTSWQLPEVDLDNVCWTESNLILVAFYEVSKDAQDCPVVAVSWNNGTCPTEGLSAKHKVLEGLFPCIEWECAQETPHPWFCAAATEKGGLSIAVHRLAYDGHVALVGNHGKESEIVEIQDDRLLLRIPLTIDDEDNFVLDMGVDFASKALTRASITCVDPRDVSKPSLPALGFVLLLTKDHAVRVYSTANLELSGKESLPQLPPLPTVLPVDFSKFCTVGSKTTCGDDLGKPSLPEQVAEEASLSQPFAAQSLPDAPKSVPKMAAQGPAFNTKVQEQDVGPSLISKSAKEPAKLSMDSEDRTSPDVKNIKEMPLALREFDKVGQEGNSEAELQFQERLQETKVLQNEVFDMLLKSIQRGGVNAGACFESFQAVGELFKRSTVLLEDLQHLKSEEFKCQASKERLKENIRDTVAALEDLKCLQKRNKVLLLDLHRPLDSELSKAWTELSEQYHSLVTNISWFERHLNNAETALRSQKAINASTKESRNRTLFMEDELLGFTKGKRAAQKMPSEIKSLYSTLHSQRELLQAQNTKLDVLTSRAKDEWDKLERTPDARTTSYLRGNSGFLGLNDENVNQSGQSSMIETPADERKVIDGQLSVEEEMRKTLSTIRISYAASLTSVPSLEQRKVAPAISTLSTKLVSDLKGASSVFTSEGADKTVRDLNEAHLALHACSKRLSTRPGKAHSRDILHKASAETTSTPPLATDRMDKVGSCLQQHASSSSVSTGDWEEDKDFKTQVDTVTTKPTLETVGDKFSALLTSPDRSSDHATASASPLATMKNSTTATAKEKNETNGSQNLGSTPVGSTTTAPTTQYKIPEHENPGKSVQATPTNLTFSKNAFGTTELLGSSKNTSEKQDTAQKPVLIPSTVTATSTAAFSTSQSSVQTNAPTFVGTLAPSLSGASTQASSAATSPTSVQGAIPQTEAFAQHTKGISSQGFFGLPAGQAKANVSAPAQTAPGHTSFGQSLAFGSGPSMATASTVGAFGPSSSPFMGSASSLSPQGSTPSSPFTSISSNAQGQVSSGFGATPQFGTGVQIQSPFGGSFASPPQPSIGFGSETAPAMGSFNSGLQAQSQSSTSSNIGGKFGAAPQIGGGFGTPSQPGSAFGTRSQLASPFGAPPQPASPFGASAQTSGGFGNVVQSSSGFATPLQSGGGFGNLAQQTSGWVAASQSPFGGGTTTQSGSSVFGGGSQGGGGFAAFASHGSGFGSVAQPSFGNPASPQQPAQAGGFGQAQAPFGAPSVPAAAKFTQMRR